MSHSNRHGSELIALALGILLLAPPVLNLVSREVGTISKPPLGEEERRELEAALTEAKRAQHVLTIRARRAEDRLAHLERWRSQDREGRFAPRSVRILPIHDPSPDRDSLWFICDGADPIPRHSVLVADAEGGRSALLGLVAGSVREGDEAIGSAAGLNVGGRILARAQTILDRLFRVRVRVADAVGFVEGTGGRDADGLPLLRLRYLDSDAPLDAGALVFSDGEDGRFPPGLLVGSVVGVIGHGDDPSYGVRAFISPDATDSGVVLVDRVLRTARAVIFDAARGEGEP